MEILNINILIYTFSFLTFIIFYKFSFLIGKKTALLDKNQVPLLGGIFLYIGYLLNYFFGYDLLTEREFIVDIYFISSIFLLALLDDRFDLNAYLRIILLSIVIIFFIYKNNLFIYSLNSKYFGFFYFSNNIFIKFLFPTFCIFVLLNAFNFTDGINCLASLIGISWFLYLIIKVPIILNIYLILILFIIAFSILNFVNKSYLGDSGNYIISTIIGVLILILNTKFPYIFYIEEILLLLLMPGIDLIRLFYVRIKNGKSPLNGDLNHLHHLLVEKFGLIKSLIVYGLLINVPIYLYYFFNSLLIYLIIFSIFTYTLLIRKISKI